MLPAIAIPPQRLIFHQKGRENQKKGKNVQNMKMF